MLPKKGDSFETHLASVGDSAWKPFRQETSVDMMLELPPKLAADMLYNDLEPESSKHWTSLLKPQSVGVFQSKITHETYRDIKSAYILTKKDQAFKHDYQLRTVHNAGISVTKTMDTGHSPFLSKPEEVTEFILSFADKLAI